MLHTIRNQGDADPRHEAYKLFFRMSFQEVAHLRKELLIAARHILVTDLRNSTYISLYNL